MFDAGTDGSAAVVRIMEGVCHFVDDGLRRTEGGPLVAVLEFCVGLVGDGFHVVAQNLGFPIFDEILVGGTHFDERLYFSGV